MQDIILIVEDDEKLAHLVQEYLGRHGYEAVVVSDGVSAVAYIRQHDPCLVILDVMLPGMSGMDVCRQVRPDYVGPILILTALDEDMDQMLGLELGADDYVIKPVKPRLLLSRVRALLRRIHALHDSRTDGQESLSKTQAVKNTLHIHLSERTAFLNSDEINLTTAEFDLLELLCKQAGKTISRDEIIKSLRGFEYDGLDRSIDRRISRLRKKLGDDPNNPNIIKTVRAKGYLLCSLIEMQP